MPAASLNIWLAVAAGGALGAMARYGINLLLFPVFGVRFPLATLAVNVLGAFLMGLCYELLFQRAALNAEWRALLMTGFLGALTTFSTFSLDVVQLWQNGQAALAALYVLANVALCLGALVAAMSICAKFL